ncbi:2-succinyl-5-enolpyruvyl-6-hydroxy-3-cyclohexene-1-carboxylic-acid synthase [Ekhidna sp.]|uniref:2-succinyl-5-enolpyruvyl-6-hydroxy-3- cyclohexene-1-carboxylic-acid synthase n=1 Tax=Ekhidna sp. TaxID=2608089 RepID=UPI003297E7B6
MLHSIVFNTAQICHQLGVVHAVMSPGSRNAPLTISFARHEKIKKWIIPDERSAGFVALGIAQETGTPVVLCCTSGTALLNYGPAIAEAYYREIPLIVLSADRPPNLIDQRDGQTIRQFEALKNHVKQSVQLPLVNSTQDATLYNQGLIKMLTECGNLPTGPVHINIPFEEPFYPNNTEKLAYQNVEMEESESAKSERLEIDELSKYTKVLILIGQQPADPELNQKLEKLSENVPVLRFPLNNLTAGIELADLFIHQQENLKPELLITCGLSVLSKKVKLFLRAHKPKKHIHFDPAGVHVDTFQSNPSIIKFPLNDFLQEWSAANADVSFRNDWFSLEKKANSALADFIGQSDFCESQAAKKIINSIPKDSNLHLSNSMPVRYADMFGVKPTIQCFSNRGTSGIDGCTSTAFGTSLVSSKLNTLITGDLAFLYDRNAFFNNYKVPNLRVIVLNNQGGGIFRLIDGPSKLPELEEYFETRHNKTAEYICAENGLEYIKADDLNSLEGNLSTLYQPSPTPKILEVFTDPETNQRVYKELKTYINERIKN